MDLEAAANALAFHAARHAAMQPQDLLKAVHQSVFGCGHLVADAARAQTYIEEEARTLPSRRGEMIETLGAEFCRVDLNILHTEGLSAATLARLLFLSAAAEGGTGEDAKALSDRLRTLPLPFPSDAFSRAARSWCAEGCPPCRHSPAYHAAYAPAYRVLRTEHARALALFAAIDRALAQRSTLTVAIDGRAGSGKTTLAALLAQIYPCNVFHLDDFFLRPEQRTAQRLAAAGENVDHGRFLSEVLLPLRAQKEVVYRRFDCASLTLRPPERIAYRPLNIIEGSYSLHPSLRPCYDLTVWLDISPETQAERLRRRCSPERAAQFFTRWIPLEEAYAAAFELPRICDLVLHAEGVPSLSRTKGSAL